MPLKLLTMPLKLQSKVLIQGLNQCLYKAGDEQALLGSGYHCSIFYYSLLVNICSAYNGSAGQQVARDPGG